MWSWRIVIIVPVNSKAAAEQSARSINSTGPDYTGEVFTLALSASGNGPPTHYAMYSSATDAMIAAMASLDISGAMFWRHDTEGKLVASNVTEAAGQAWGLSQSLDAGGLSVVDAPSV
jgi:hypothetical protein